MHICHFHELSIHQKMSHHPWEFMNIKIVGLAVFPQGQSITDYD